MLQKIVDSLRTWANETIIVRELLKGDVPREAKSQNSSEPVSVLGQDPGRLIPLAPTERNVMKPRYLVVIYVQIIHVYIKPKYLNEIHLVFNTIFSKIFNPTLFMIKY